MSETTDGQGGQVVNGELIVVEKLNAVEIFTGPQGVAKIIADIEAKVAAFTPDTTTPKGRKDIASLAYKVSQSKIVLDDLGKGLVTEWKAKSALVDASRKTVRDSLDALRDKTRQPLTEWEAAEEARVAAELAAEKYQRDWDEALALHSLWLREQEVKAKEAEFARIEAERVAKEEAERLERERIEKEEAIRKEAADHARQEAEAEAARKIEEAEQAKRDAQAAAERAELEKKEAAERAEQARLAAERKAEEDRARAVREAEEKANAEAARIERERLEKERLERVAKEQQEAEAARKAADVEHRRAINNAAAKAVQSLGITEAKAIEVIKAIAGGLIPNVTIKY